MDNAGVPLDLNTYDFDEEYISQYLPYVKGEESVGGDTYYGIQFGVISNMNQTVSDTQTVMYVEGFDGEYSYDEDEIIEETSIDVTITAIADYSDYVVGSRTLTITIPEEKIIYNSGVDIKGVGISFLSVLGVMVVMMLFAIFFKKFKSKSTKGGV